MALTDEEKLIRKRASNKKWADKNREAVREKDRKWRKNNPAKNAAREAKRRAAKLHRTPCWADLDAINDVYLEAQYMQLHVDHIIPLQGKNVSGLHVWENLQLLSPEDNQRKSNTWET